MDNAGSFPGFRWLLTSKPGADDPIRSMSQHRRALQGCRHHRRNHRHDPCHHSRIPMLAAPNVRQAEAASPGRILLPPTTHRAGWVLPRDMDTLLEQHQPWDSPDSTDRLPTN